MNNSKNLLVRNQIVNLFEDSFFEKIDYNENLVVNSEVQSLIKSNVLIQRDDKLFINYRKKSNIFLKNLIDQIKFEQINEKLQREVQYIVKELKKKNRNKIFSLFLIGSVARNTDRSTSDLDLVVIHSGENIKKPSFPNQLKKVQYITFTSNLFPEKIWENEIFVWALKYGILIYDRNFIFQKVNLTSQSSEKIILNKRTQIDHLCNTFDTMVNKEEEYSKDLKLILNKLLYAISRYIILLHNDFPLSTPELKEQVKQYDINIVNIYKYFKQENLTRDELLNIYFELKSIFKKFKVN